MASILERVRSGCKAGLWATLAVLALSSFALAAVTQGTHIISLGVSGPAISHETQQQGDLPANGSPNHYDSGNIPVGRVAPELQYLYAFTPSIAAGFYASGFASSDSRVSGYRSYPGNSAYSVAFNSTVKAIAFVPTARYTWRADRALNPFAEIGVGGQYLRQTSVVTEAGFDFVYNPGYTQVPLNPTVTTTTTRLGPVVTAGLGLQGSIGDNFLIGSGVHWMTSQPESAQFGGKYTQSVDLLFWLGWKWVAPL